jgi:hypothetical protein
MLTGVIMAEKTFAGVELGPEDLMAGFEARKVLLKEGRVVLDARVFSYGHEREGVLTTDPIDLGPSDGVLALPAEIGKIDIRVDADAPEGTSLRIEARTGDALFDQSDWSKWQVLKAPKDAVRRPAGRFVQIRATLGSSGKEALPSITGITIAPEIARAGRTVGVKVVEAAVQKIVRSPVDFKYERPDQKDIVAFRKAAGLDEVVEGAADDFEKLVRLMDWAGSCHNDRTQKKHIHNGRYTWDINRIFEVVEAEVEGKKVRRPTVYGHCMSYAELMCTAAVSMGYVSARHNAVGGFREATHEVCDIWVPSLGKWVYFDPSLTSYYYDLETKVPMSILETHDVICDRFIPEGKDMSWFLQRRSKETRQMVKKVGGKKVIGCRLGPWRYGKPMPRDYDWGWSHSYLANGFVTMTPRNDFQSHPDAIPKHFGWMIPAEGHPYWSDEKTPVRRRVTDWYTRKRDFYWTLDQASLRLEATAEDGVLRVELGNSMPFFREYRLQVDGKGVAAANPYIWKLKPGANRLHVAPVDEFDKVGLASSVALVWEKLE